MLLKYRLSGCSFGAALFVKKKYCCVKTASLWQDLDSEFIAAMIMCFSMLPEKSKQRRQESRISSYKKQKSPSHIAELVLIVTISIFLETQAFHIFSIWQRT